MSPSRSLKRIAARRWTIIGSLAIVVAAALAYHNSFRVPFIFDDQPAILENESIRQLTTALRPPRDSGVPVSGRPLLNLSLAINYAIGGTDVRGYHGVNLAVHAMAGLLLFGVVRRTLAGSPACARFASVADPIALLGAMLWTVHPLQTEAVTYVVQRAESLVGLFYLATLYCFIRGTEVQARAKAGNAGARWWYVGAVLACAAGMATKEVMVTAPVMVLLYDRIFLAGSWSTVARDRARWHIALACTWAVLVFAMWSAGDRGGSAGFSLGVSWWQYGLTQCKAIVQYLRLAVWPVQLTLDYQMPIVERWTEVWWQSLLVGALLLGTIWALGRKSAVGFFGAWFFAILAPTSSIVPLADTVFEHRMYLPLAAVVVASVLTAYAWMRRGAFVAGVSVGLAFVAVTVARNRDYQSEESIWKDTVAKRPTNVRARYTLGTILAGQGRIAEAMEQYEKALELEPDSAQAHINLANVLAQTQRPGEAIAHYEIALRISPDSADAHTNLGLVLAQVGKLDEGTDHLQRAVELRPDSAVAHNNLGNLCARLGRMGEARMHFEAAVRLRPHFMQARVNLGNVLAQAGELDAAIREYREALRHQADFAEARYNLATALAIVGRDAEAIAEYEETLRLQPGHAAARANLNVLRARAGERRE